MQKIGFHFYSSGKAWEEAYQQAVLFSKNQEGLLLFGSRIGDSGQAWIKNKTFADTAIHFGSQSQTWDEWIKSLARAQALDSGHGFKVFNRSSKREYLRKILEILTKAQVFNHLNAIWKEEKFFSALIDCVEEARLAGLYEESAIERAKELLLKGDDPVSRAAYEDFWHLLLAYEKGLNAQEGALHDKASLFRLAKEIDFNKLPKEIFLLGFEQLSALEVDFLQALAKERVVHLPLALSSEKIEKICAGKEQNPDCVISLSLLGLLTGFSGEVFNHAKPIKPDSEKQFLLHSHTAREELRVGGAFANYLLTQDKELRFVVDKKFLEDNQEILRAELKLPFAPMAHRALLHPVAQIFFHALLLKEKDYELSYGLEFSRLLQFSTKDFSSIPMRASKAGVRKGLSDWKRKAMRHNDEELRRYADFLEELDDIFPQKANAAVFAEKIDQFAELIGIAEFARIAPDAERERESHGALAAILRNAQMLAATTTSEFTFSEWAQELKILLEQTYVGTGYSYFPALQFYQHEEWLPPEDKNSFTIVLGFQSGIGPNHSFNFYFEEGARRKLSDLLLPTQVQAEMAFLDSIKKLHGLQNIVFSYAKFELSGKEISKSWISDVLDFSELPWPEAAPQRPFPKGNENLAEVIVPGAEIKNYSASLFESYKACPFQAIARKFLRLEDKIQESTLDVSRLDEGSIVHKALEIYYDEKNGKELLDPESRNKVIGECLESAVRAQKIEFYKGSEELLRIQVKRLHELLINFLTSDIANYAAFPYFRKPETETQVSGLIDGKYPWNGTIDRIDIDETNKKFLVADYKIGATTPTSKEIQELERFQLQLYMDAAVEKFPGFEPIGGVYISLKSGKRNQGMVREIFNEAKKNTEPGPKYFKLNTRNASLLEEENFNSLRERTREELKKLAAKMSEGDFSVSPADEEKSCKRCEIRPACRIRGIQAPAALSWPRGDLQPFFKQILNREFPKIEKEVKKDKAFNEAQKMALEKSGALVLVEASAGTGKTTVIVEKIHRFITEKVDKEPVYRAVERFTAISFTEKSTQELADRLSLSLMKDPALGASAASLARRQISTIHGFCRKIIADFPVEAGVSPMAQMLDAKETDKLKSEVLEEFFLYPEGQDADALAILYNEYPRHKIESILSDLLDKRELWKNDLASYEKILRDGGNSPSLPEDAFRREILMAILKLHSRLLQQYAKKKKEADVLDFSDLESLALHVLKAEHARKYYQDKYALILVDEFQDTNTIQREILDKIAHKNGDNLFLVGDAKQSIYRFRNADVSVFQNLRKEAEQKGNLVQLHMNYRSRKEIVEAANKISEAMFPKDSEDVPNYEALASLSTAFGKPGGKVQVIRYGDKEEELLAADKKKQESEILVSLIKKLVNQDKRSYGKIAILLRKVSGNEIYLKALTKAGIPFRIGASRGFFTQQVVMDGLSLLRALTDESNDLALLALLRSPWIALSDAKIYELRKTPGKFFAEKITEQEAPFWLEAKKLATHLSLSRTLELAYEKYPLGRREHFQAEKLITLVRNLESSGRTKFETVNEISLWAGWEKEEDANDDSVMPEPESDGAVQILTIHAAKGLEFDITILPDLDSDLMRAKGNFRLVSGIGLSVKQDDEDAPPDFKALNDENSKREIAELKRLFYVAITRAKEEQYLLLSHFSKKKNKADTWGEFLRASDLKGVAEYIEAETLKDALDTKIDAAIIPPKQALPKNVNIPFRFETSISELAAFQFCAEFHRRKFVQTWDDRLVNLWPKPKGSFRKYLEKERDTDPKKAEVEKLLKSLKIEKKERGIALHRVLERVKGDNFSLFPVWLTEAYEAQGVDIEKKNFSLLLKLDLELLQSFLTSPLGKELFASENKAYPEIPFEWQLGDKILHGTIDRLIQNPAGDWIVVDYKSSILEESLERYEFQVASYAAAVERAEIAKGNKKPVVRGYLVDLFSAKSFPVAAQAKNAEQILVEEMNRAQNNYTLADSEIRNALRGIVGGDHCFSCAYSMHCDVGTKFVLGFQ